ncbi:MAG: DNA primase [Saprospiraceae bacterium]|nr:DNA primase [Candidatus Vicinibacter affinis]MBK6572220.1 DNA primase [Candidatus Vicinibacter affinis]MBK7799196.1 DNA primase [Candidatus Vicinibacter affinis]
MIARSSIQKVVETSRVEEVVRDYVDLKTRGANLTGLCPFHKEKTPSFSVSPSKNIYKCFGCGKAGSPVDFIMEIEQYTFPEAIRHLAKKYRIELEETAQTQESIDEALEVQSLNIVNQWALDYYATQLWESDLGRSIGLGYFKERGFLETTLRKFDIGFAQDEYQAFTSESIKKGYSIDLLKKLGLTSSNGNDFFRNRIIFPIHNQGGKVIGFAGRVLDKEAKVAKYINSPETEVYKKSKTLYGLHLAKAAIRKLGSCILVEGYTDVMSLVQSGIENVVASSGTSLTEDQVQLIKRHCENVIILYDGDDAGIKAAMRGIDMILKEGLNVYIGLIPDRDDPDSFIRKVGYEGFQKFLAEEVKDFILFKINLLKKETQNDPIQRANVINDIVGTIAKIDDPVKRSVYLQNASHFLNIDEATLISSANKLIKEDIKNKSFAAQRKALDHDEQIIKEQEEIISFKKQNEPYLHKGDEFQEKEILKILILEGDKKWRQENITTAQFLVANLNDVIDYFDNKLYADVLQQVETDINQGNIVNLNYFLHHPDKNISQLAIELTSSPYVYSNNWADKYGIYLLGNQSDMEFSADDVEKIIKHIKYRKFHKVILDIDQQIKAAQSFEEQIELVKAREELKKIKNTLYEEVWGGYK